MKKLAVLLLGVMGLGLLAGCDDPGPFGRQVAGFFRAENQRRENVDIGFDRYARIQKERPAELAAQMKSYVDKETLQTGEFQNDWGRLRDQQSRKLPKCLPNEKE